MFMPQFTQISGLGFRVAIELSFAHVGRVKF